MIRTAITKLNEEGGSTEESISVFIEKEYEDLPWAHAAFLRHHLRKLCATGEIVRKNDGHYVIDVDGCDFGDGMSIRRGREILHTCHVGDGFQVELKKNVREDCYLTKQKIEAECQAEAKEIEVLNKWNKVKEKREVCEQCCQVEKHEIEDESEVSRRDFEATVQQSVRVELSDEERYNPQNQQLVVTEGPNHLQILKFEVSDGHTLESEELTMVTEDQGVPQELQEQQIEVMNGKKMEDQILVTISSASQTIGQCSDCNGPSFSLKEPCMELVKKKTESQEQLMENSHALGAMELPEYENSGLVMEEEKKVRFKVDQQQLIKSPCTEKASNIEVIEGKKLMQEQEDKLTKEASLAHELQSEVETKLFGLCYYNRDIVSKKFWVSDTPLPTAKKEQKESLKLEQQQTMSTFGEKQLIVVCGLKAQKLSRQKIFGRQEALNSHPDNEQQKQSESQAGRSCLIPKLDADTPMRALPPSDCVHDTEQQHHCQPEGKGQGGPSKPEGNGDHHQSFRVYVRRGRRL